MTPNERLARLAMSSPASVFVHRLALCESDEVGAGTQIWAFAHVMKGAVIGRDCNIGDHAFIETGARIGDRVTVKNQAMGAKASNTSAIDVERKRTAASVWRSVNLDPRIALKT